MTQHAPISSGRTSRFIRLIVEDIWNKGNLDLADRLFTVNYVNHGGLIPDLIRGPEVIKLAVVTARLAFPGLRIVIDNLVVEGHVAEFRWAALECPATGGRSSSESPTVVRVTGVTLARFAAGQVAESWTRWDTEHRGATLDHGAARLIANRSDTASRIERYQARALGQPDHWNSIRQDARTGAAADAPVEIPNELRHRNRLVATTRNGRADRQYRGHAV
jgi:hypothetical protein